MIDNFALAISHGLIAVTVWLLLRRPELDTEAPSQDDPTPPIARSFRKRRERPRA